MVPRVAGRAVSRAPRNRVARRTASDSATAASPIGSPGGVPGGGPLRSDASNRECQRCDACERTRRLHIHIITDGRSEERGGRSEEGGGRSEREGKGAGDRLRARGPRTRAFSVAISGPQFPVSCYPALSSIVLGPSQRDLHAPRRYVRSAHCGELATA